MKNEKMISIIGIAWLLLWISYIPVLVSHYPFHELKGVKSLIEEVSKSPDFIKKESSLLNKNPKELEDSVMGEIRIVWIEGVLIVFSGIVIAVLLLKKKRSGRILALFLAAYLLLVKVFYFVKYWQYKASLEYWKVSFQHFPTRTIQGIVATIIMIVTIALLLRPQDHEPNEPVPQRRAKGRRVRRVLGLKIQIGDHDEQRTSGT